MRAIALFLLQKTSCFILILLSTQPAFSANPRIETSLQGWTQIAEDDGITIYRRKLGNSKIFEFRGIGIAPVPIPKIVAIMADANRMPEWVFGCIKGELLERNFDFKDFSRAPDEYQQILYGVNELPWPLHNRDYVLRSYVSFLPPEGELTLRVSILSDHSLYPQKPPTEENVRLPAIKVTILLTPLDGPAQGTLVDFATTLDPGGNIPNWIANLAGRQIPTLSIKRIQGFKEIDSYDRDAEELASYHYKRYMNQYKQRRRP